MNIDEMQAGREMDALIAEKTMGLILDSDNPFLANIVVFEANTGENTGHTQNLPHYSTEMAAAWEVWEWLKTQYHEINFTWCKGVCYLTIFEHGNCILGADAETFPLAICRSALKALGVQA